MTDNRNNTITQADSMPSILQGYLYKIHLQDAIGTGGRFLYFTSIDREVEYGGDIYEPAPIKHAAFDASGDHSVTVSAFIGRGKSWVLEVMSSSDDLISIEILYFNGGVLTGNSLSEAYSLFRGSVSSKSLSKGTLALKVDDVFKKPASTVGWRSCSASCPLSLYGKICGVKKELFKQKAFITAIDANTSIIYVSKIPMDSNTQYASGYMVVESICGLSILGNAQAGENVALYVPAIPPFVKPGMAVEIYPGCDKSLQTCQNFFKNESRFGGFPFVPRGCPNTEGL